MRPNPILNFTPVRIADQAAGALREAVHRGVWGSYLPGEHDLARQLSISRPTVHDALLTLVKEGLIATSHGRRARILYSTHQPEINPGVCVVAPASRGTIGLADNPLLMALRVQLTAQGFTWEEAFDANLSGKAPERTLEKLVAGRRHVCWLVVSASSPVQRWFETARVPALVLGSCHPGVRLPSVDWDYAAVGWHAAGTLTRFGHRHIALIMLDRSLPGASACRDSVIRYLKQIDKLGSVEVLKFEDNVADLHAKLDRLAAQRPRPTAIFAPHLEHALTALVHLPRRGLRIPEDISVIAGGTHSLFEMSIPELTRYRSSSLRTIRQTVRVVQLLLAGRLAPLKPFLIEPNFVLGRTLGRNQPG